jgi:translation initiation factor 3 subunit D
MSFVVPVVVDNAEGWGPVGQPDNLFDAPFAPFNKSDKLGKAADWLQTNRPYKHQYYNQGKGANSAFDYKQVVDLVSFRLV